MEFISYCNGLIDVQSLIAKSDKLHISKHTSGFLKYRSNCHNSYLIRGSILCQCLDNFYMIYLPQEFSTRNIYNWLYKGINIICAAILCKP